MLNAKHIGKAAQSEGAHQHAVVDVDSISMDVKGAHQKETQSPKTINKRYRQKIVKETSAEEREKMFDDIDRERVPIEEDITGEIVSYLFELAYHYRVPTPNFSELEPWETSIYTGRRQLTAKALAEFRKTIRDEQKERWQFWELRAKMMTAFVTGLTGAVGALIGLIAIWGK